MADYSNRHPLNVPGPFFVDDTCVDCDQCRGEAPHAFRRDDQTGSTYVHSQPLTPEEIASATDAMNRCPTDSIGQREG